MRNVTGVQGPKLITFQSQQRHSVTIVTHELHLECLARAVNNLVPTSPRTKPCAGKLQVSATTSSSLIGFMILAGGQGHKARLRRAMFDKPRAADIQASSVRCSETAIHHIPRAVSILDLFDDLILHPMLQQGLRKHLPL